MSGTAGARLCVASSDPALRGHIADAVAEQGYEVALANTLGDLVSQIATAGAGCAIVDPRLPGLGRRPESRLRAEPALHRCPLIILDPDELDGFDGPPPSRHQVELLIRIHSQLAGGAQLELLHGVSQQLTKSPDMEHTLNSVLDAVAEALAFDTATLFTLDEEGRAVIRATWGYELAADHMHSFATGEGVVGWVIATRSPTIVGDSNLDQRFASMEGRTPRSMLAVPITIGERVLGALSLVRRSTSTQFTDSDLLLVATIGNSAAIALENARMHEQERALALRLEEVNQLYGEERQVLDKLEHFNRLYSEVVSTVSHELKTPLMGIRGYAKMIEAGDVDFDEARDFAREIYDNAMRLSTYVERVLQEEAVAQGKLTLDLREVRLRTLVDQVFRSLRPAATDGHVLVNDVDADTPLLSADPEKVIQILVNLVSNAIKYSPNGGRICVGATADDRFVEISVRDQGMGIPTEARAHIFERFYRVQSYETRSVAGSGLGLSIVKGLVELHGGEIGAEPNPDGGSRFHFTLPRAVYFPGPAEYASLAHGSANPVEEQ